ncbi:uncharacterized protein LOC120407706 [Mauremys reevesii]|uniref:uncharacterized protein LOC120407706 n=1 Tax=Mauremys reevesii TaxID=260615 RepID=UPI00193ECE2E|nr:uncharacterized protein LOC120407706 [Mauremys reevesii]
MTYLPAEMIQLSDLVHVSTNLPNICDSFTKKSLSDYALTLKKSGLSLNSFRIHLVVITAFHQPIEGYSVLSHSITKRFFKSIINLFPQPQLPTPMWYLKLLLQGLTRPLFQPMTTCLLTNLSMKTVFLIAITSAKRIGKITALMLHPPYTVFFPDKVTLRPHPKFNPKVTSLFHMNQLIHLPVFYPKLFTKTNREAILHNLDVRGALAFYLDRTMAFRKSPRLFLSIAEGFKGSPISAQRVSKCVSNCIRQCYQICSMTPPDSIRTHSTRSVSSSVASFKNVPITDSCRAARWASVHTFAEHYAITGDSAFDAIFSSMVICN